jgi:hypothetical protein
MAETARFNTCAFKPGAVFASRSTSACEPAAAAPFANMNTRQNTADLPEQRNKFAIMQSSEI